MWHVSSRSGVATLRTAIHLLLSYLLCFRVVCPLCLQIAHTCITEASPYSITERRVPELIPVLDSQPAGDVSHKPGDRLPLLSARPAVTPATLKRAATNFAAW